jgi:predicted CoA-binding protein
MATRAAVDHFVGLKTLALVGVSRSGKKFGNAVLKELVAKGYTVYPIHPEVQDIGGQRTYPSLSATPTTPGGVVVVVPPSRAEAVVRDAHAAGIGAVWLQQGAGSPEAVRAAESLGMTVVNGECILMFTEPAAWFHRAHRWVWKVTGKLPQ